MAAPAGAKAKTKPPANPKPPAGPPPVYVFPAPNTGFASPTTQIAFRGVSAGQLGQVSVTGSSSGAHDGTVEGDSDGRGGSFVPSTPFAPGETVTVSTSLNLEGSHSGSYQFRVARPAGPVPFEHRPAAPRVTGDVWYFRSRPDLTPAAVTITKRDPTAPGDIFVAPQVGPLQQGPEIIGPNGGLIWFSPVPHDYAATDFRVQSYQGRPVLTWWQGNESAGVGSGQDIIMNSSYEVVKTVSAANGLSADLHEFQLTPYGTALITAEYPVYANATAASGVANEVVLDSVVQEIDVPTGLVEFEWHSLDHVGVTDGYTKPPNAPKKKGKKPLPNFAWDPYDYFHLNSIGLDRDGNLVISARNTWGVYKIDHHTGAVIWTLGGKHSSFRLAAGASFAFQHDVRVRARGDQILSMFDDGAGPPYVHSQSRALELRLNLKRRTATVVTQRVHSPPLLASFEGDDQQLAGADNFVGWGQQPYFSQFNAKGKLVFDGRFVGSNLTYRAYRFAWNGTPSAPPAFAVSRHGAKMTVYASWNGATNVAGWRVFGGSRPSKMPAVATAPKHGFETAINARAWRYVAVEALDAKGHALARSPVQGPGG
ncbi:MAG TPA: arylsulfotransferase family protein [Solirubrobacteraceae bacterium]|nr:arylsulfotransferase family protein [Solirubrobacteraceae bacterium]